MKKIIYFVIFLLFMGGIMQVNTFAYKNTEKAVFAGGCFWCMESNFEEISGVKDVISGYTGGTVADPTYEDYGEKGYIEAVEITYDPEIITYERLLDIFWRSIDPLDAGGQFCDRGHEYITAIFYNSGEQKRLAEKTKEALGNSGQLKGTIATKIMEAGKFYPAEDYHQDYYKKNPIRYKFYRFNCGRDRRTKEVWGEAADTYAPILRSTRYKRLSNQEIKNRLTPLQYKVTQENDTEPAFDNELWFPKTRTI